MTFKIAKLGDSHHGFNQPVVTNDQAEEGFPEQEKNPRIVQFETLLCHTINGCLQMHYPGHMWNIEVAYNNHPKANGGTVAIRLPFSNVPALLFIGDLWGDVSLKQVVRAGGHLLERFNLGRSGFDMSDFFTAIKKDPLGYRRNTIPGGTAKGFN